LRQQLKVLRDARGPRNFHRLCAIADAADNLPAAGTTHNVNELGSDYGAAGFSGLRRFSW